MPFEIKHIMSDEEAVTLRDELIDVYPLSQIPPDQPEPEPPEPPEPLPPEPPSKDLWNTSFQQTWNQKLSTDKQTYRNVNVLNRKAAGTSMEILLPRMTQDHKLKMTDVEHTGTPHARYGVFSWRRDFSAPFVDEHVWGQGGGVAAIVKPKDSGRILYFNHRILRADLRFAPWWSMLQARFRVV